MKNNESDKTKLDIVKKKYTNENRESMVQSLTRDRGGIDISYVLAHFPIGYKCITFGQE